MQKKFSQLDISSSGKVIIILDGGESADDHWTGVLNITRDLINRLPAASSREIYMLGNPQAISEATLDFPSRLKDENRYRGSFIAPLVPLMQGPVERVVFIGSGPIYDLEDHRDLPCLKSSLFISLGGNSMRGNVRVGEETDSEGYISYLRETRRAVRKVKIEGEMFMPFYWSGGKYRFDMKGDDAVLISDGTENFNLLIGYYGESAGAILTLDNEKEEVIPLGAGEEINPQWKPLTPEEARLYRMAAGGLEYTCPHCGEKHAPQEVRCPNVGILGRIIYPSLEGRNGLVMLREAGGEVQYSCDETGAFPAGEGKVAVMNGPEAALFGFDRDEGKWRKFETLSQYMKTGNSKRLIWV